MNKSELLLKNFSILSKKPIDNANALKSLIVQLCREDPQSAINCWRDILLNNVDQMEGYWGKTEYPFNSIGWLYVYDFLYAVMRDWSFECVVITFAQDNDLLDILYTKTFFDPAYPYRIAETGKGVLSQLLKEKEFMLAESILAAIYKSETFPFFSELWEYIIKGMRHISRDEDLQNFCLEWVERIPDEEQKAAAITFVMRIL